MIYVKLHFQFKDVIPCSDQCDSFDPVSIDMLVDSNEICVVLDGGQVVTIDAESHTVGSGFVVYLVLK